MEFIKNLFNPKKNQNSDSIKAYTTEDIKSLLSKDKLDASKLPTLLEMRSRKEISFILVDVREVGEYNSCRIDGVDHHIPTSSFYEKITTLENKKNSTIILQCHSGGRSLQCQKIMQSMNYTKVINLSGGISKFNGETISGE